jgi:hypothetical protein
MINATNMLGKYNPAWPLASSLEAVKVQVTGGSPGLTGPGRRPRPPARPAPARLTAGSGLRSAGASLAGWVADLPHRIGAWFFAMNDTEAGWRRWEITELRWGLARSYHDPRFDWLRTLHALDPEAAAAFRGPEAPPVAGPSTTVRPADGWDDVHGWPWDADV